MESSNILFFNLDKEDKIISEVKSKYSKLKNINISYAYAVDEAFDNIKIQDGVIFIFSVSSKEQFLSGVDLIKKNYKFIRKGVIIPLCISDLHSLKLKRILFKLGCTELYDRYTNPISIANKVDMLLLKMNKLVDIVEDEAFFTETIDSSPLLSDKTAKNDYISDESEAEVDSFINNIEESNEESVTQTYHYIEDGKVKNLNLDSGNLELTFKKDHSDDKLDCKLHDFDNEKISIEVSRETEILLNEKIEIFIFFKYNKCKIDVELTGAIVDIEEFDEDKKLLVIKLIKLDSYAFDYFISLFQSRQENINKFLKLAKGI